jgi:hypothetical protein
MGCVNSVPEELRGSEASAKAREAKAVAEALNEFEKKLMFEGVTYEKAAAAAANPNSTPERLSKMLYDAMKQNNVGPEVMPILLKGGARANWGTPVERYSILQEVASRRSTQEAEMLLLHGADINAADCGGYTPLMKAALFHPKVEMVEFLLRAGGEFLSSQRPVHTFALSLSRLSSFLLAVCCVADPMRSDGRTYCKPSVLAAFRVWEEQGKPVQRILNEQQKQEQRKLEAAEAKVAAEQQVRVQEAMSRALEICRTLAFSIAKHSLYAAATSPLAQSPGYTDRLLKREELQSLLFETLSVHPVVLYLTDASAAASYQTGLSEFVQPKLVPFLDEPPAAIRLEVERAASAFMQREQEKAQSNAALKAQMEATERNIAALREGAAQAASAAASAAAAVAAAARSPASSASASAASASPKKAEEGQDWAKRFQQASSAYDGLKKFGLLPF